MAPTISDIARVVGVKKSTVSVVLNRKATAIRVSDRTREKIFQAAQELGYHPNAAARALSTKRTGYIGFMLSDDMAGGWNNSFYATVLAGVEEYCNRRNYGLTISRYNLSNVDTFLFPTRVGQRSVDALVLAGYVTAAVAARFREFGIPCVTVGDNHEVRDLFPTVSSDIVTGLGLGVEHAAKHGHVRIGIATASTPRAREVGELVINRARSQRSTAHCRLSLIDTGNLHADYDQGKPLLEFWLAMTPNERPTALVGGDQPLARFLRELYGRGLSCPEDVSLVTSGDTPLCEWTHPGLSGPKFDYEHLGAAAAKMLLDHLDEGKPLTPDMTYVEPACGFCDRGSCGLRKD